MPRPAKLTSDEILDRALPLFWRHGIDGVTVDMLEGATGLGRQSLYNQFTDKAGLFRAAVDRYRQLTDSLLERLRAPDAGIADIVDFFRRARTIQRQIGSYSCLAAKTAADRGDDASAHGSACATTRAVRDAFTVILTRAAAAGALRPGLDPRLAADLLWSAGNGAAALAATDDERRAAAVIDLVVAQLAPAP